MAITSEEIHNQSFTVDRKGYDVDEVDVFLEHVATEIDGLNAEINELHSRLAQYEGRGSNVLDMDAAFAEPASPEQLAAQASNSAADTEKDARIAELERQLEEKDNDVSAIANALVTAQRSAKEVVDAAQQEAKRIHDDAEADADDIIDRANAEREKIQKNIEELERAHKETCENYSDTLRAFVEDASKKIDDIEEELAKSEGKKRPQGRFASPTQAPIHKPASPGVTGAVAPSYTAPAMPDSSVTNSVTSANPVPTATVKPSKVDKDLSGYGDASDAFDLGDID